MAEFISLSAILLLDLENRKPVEMMDEIADLHKQLKKQGFYGTLSG